MCGFSDAKVEDYFGKRLTCSFQTSIKCNPALSKVVQLRRWFDTYGKPNIGSFKALSEESNGNTPLLTIEKIHFELCNINEEELMNKGFWCRSSVELVNIRRDRQNYWIGCPFCKSKVIFKDDVSCSGVATEDNRAFCQKCLKNVEKPIKHYSLRVQVGDSTGMVDAVALGDCGTALMGGIAAEELSRLEEIEMSRKGTEDIKLSDIYLSRLGTRYILKMHGKLETFKGIQNIIYRIHSVESLGSEDTENIM